MMQSLPNRCCQAFLGNPVKELLLYLISVFDWVKGSMPVRCQELQDHFSVISSLSSLGLVNNLGWWDPSLVLAASLRLPRSQVFGAPRFSVSAADRWQLKTLSKTFLPPVAFDLPVIFSSSFYIWLNNFYQLSDQENSCCTFYLSKKAFLHMLSNI